MGRVKKAIAKRPEKGPGSVADETFEGIRKMYEEEPNKSKLARMFGVSLTTVYKALGKTDPESQRERRVESMGRIAGKMTDRIEALLDGLDTPPEASFMQRATVVGILTDKVEKLDKRLEDSKREEALAALPMPETVEAMAGALRNELRSVAFILQLNPAGSQIVEEARQLEEKIGQRLVEAEVVETIDDLDVGV